MEWPPHLEEPQEVERQQDRKGQEVPEDEEEAKVKSWQQWGVHPPAFLPARKVKDGWFMHTKPKQRPKPPDTQQHKRAVSARSPEERKRLRAERVAEDDVTLPWDARGPPGPQEGGPKVWLKQKYRPNTGRWANAGGRHREKYKLWRQKAAEGLTGKELAFYHPMTKDGYWERECNRLGVMCPRVMKDI